jgi:hypothetical protein
MAYKMRMVSYNTACLECCFPLYTYNYANSIWLDRGLSKNPFERPCMVRPKINDFVEGIILELLKQKKNVLQKHCKTSKTGGT